MWRRKPNIMHSKLHIIVPTFNNESTILATIESLLNQTYKDLFIWIINDGSTDNTLLVLEQFESNKRVKVITKSNGGAGEARNLGIQKAKQNGAEYIGFCDADDFAHPQKFEIQMSVMSSSPNTDVVVTGEKYVASNYEPNCLPFYDVNTIKHNVISNLFEMLCNKNFNYHPASSLIRARLFSESARFTNHTCGEDYWLHLYLAAKDSVFRRVEKEMYFSRQFENSLQRSPGASYYDGLARFSAINKLLSDEYNITNESKRLFLQEAKDRFLRWHVSGARTVYPYTGSLVVCLKNFNNFNSKTLALIELSKSIINPIVRLVKQSRI